MITNLKRDSAKFLGVLIGTNTDLTSAYTRNVKGIKKRVGRVNVTMRAPIESLLQRLSSNGFIQLVNNRIKPLLCRALSPLPTINLILRYRSILNGYLQYYSFVDNFLKLKAIYRVLRASLEKTICYKENINKETFHMTYGKNITLTITNKLGSTQSLNFAPPELKFTPTNFLFDDIKDPLLAKV